jgi:hypothetical protein
MVFKAQRLQVLKRTYIMKNILTAKWPQEPKNQTKCSDNLKLMKVTNVNNLSVRKEIGNLRSKEKYKDTNEWLKILAIKKRSNSQNCQATKETMKLAKPEAEEARNIVIARV